MPKRFTYFLTIVQRQDRSDLKLRRKGLILVPLQALHPANTSPCVQLYVYK